MRHGAALLTLVVVIALMIGGWSAHDAAPGQNDPAPAAIGGGPRAPSDLDESGITTATSTPAPAIRPRTDGPSVAKSRAPLRSQPRRPAAAGPLEPLDQSQAGPVESRTSVDAPLPGPASAPPARTQGSDPGIASPSAALTGGNGPQVGQQSPSQAPAPESPPPAAATAPPVPPPAPAVLTPPVPLHLTPPRHPLPYRMIVDAPGLSSTARLEAVEARVRLRLLIRADGSVAGVEVAVPSGRPELDAAALDAARHWRFLPARRDGEPIDSVALIWVAFVVGP